MGLFPTLYAHWRLNSMVRVWRKAKNLLDKSSSFVMSHCSAEQNDRFEKAIKSIESVFDEVTASVEDDIISDLKERV